MVYPCQFSLFLFWIQFREQGCTAKWGILIVQRHFNVNNRILRPIHNRTYTQTLGIIFVTIEKFFFCWLKRRLKGMWELLLQTTYLHNVKLSYYQLFTQDRGNCVLSSVYSQFQYSNQVNRWIAVVFSFSSQL